MHDQGGSASGGDRGSVAVSRTLRDRRAVTRTLRDRPWALAVTRTLRDRLLDQQCCRTAMRSSTWPRRVVATGTSLAESGSAACLTGAEFHPQTELINQDLQLIKFLYKLYLFF